MKQFIRKAFQSFSQSASCQQWFLRLAAPYAFHKVDLRCSFVICFEFLVSRCRTIFFMSNVNCGWEGYLYFYKYYGWSLSWTRSTWSRIFSKSSSIFFRFSNDIEFSFWCKMSLWICYKDNLRFLNFFQLWLSRDIIAGLVAMWYTNIWLEMLNGIQFDSLGWGNFWRLAFVRCFIGCTSLLR